MEPSAFGYLLHGINTAVNRYIQHSLPHPNTLRSGGPSQGTHETSFEEDKSEGQSGGLYCNELVSDVPSMRSFKGRSLEEAARSNTYQLERGYDSSGEAQRRTSPLARSPLAEQEGIRTPKLFRLRCWETWELLAHEEWLCDLQLSHEGRSDSDYTWSSTGPWICDSPTANKGKKTTAPHGWVPLKIDLIDYDYDSYTIWCLNKRGTRSRPWILFAGEAENRGIHYLVAQPTSQYQVKAVDGCKVLRNGREYTRDCRLVELEYQEYQKFQTAAALREWAAEFAEDLITVKALGLLEGLRNLGRIVLRSVSRPGAGLVLDGRVQGTENDTMAESFQPRSAYDFTGQRRAAVKGEKSTAHYYEQSNAGASVSQNNGEESGTGAVTAVSLSGDTSNRPLGLRQSGVHGTGDTSSGTCSSESKTVTSKDTIISEPSAASTSSSGAAGSDTSGIRKRRRGYPSPIYKHPVRHTRSFATEHANGGCYRCWLHALQHCNDPDLLLNYRCKHTGRYIWLSWARDPERPYRDWTQPTD